MTAVDERVETRRRSALSHPMSSYYLLLGSTLLLLGLGLVMVLSASSIESIRIFDSAYTLAQRQAMFAVVGVILMLAATKVPPRVWRGVSVVALALAVAALVAVLIPGIGREVYGQRNWIEIAGPFRFQPSEFAKLALVVWGAATLSRKGQLLARWPHLLIPIVPVGAAIVGLVLLEGDFGNAMMLAGILVALLFVAGAPLRLFALVGAALGALGVVMVMTESYRLERMMSWLDPGADRLGSGWQLTQGLYALGTGGWWGVGLGASREKWGSLPEAHTDFIFPIIGEELGLVGTIGVLVLLAGISFACFRLSVISKDSFVRIASGGVGAWITLQAVVNIGAVLGLLPITGVPLPLVSYGGSSLIPTLIALGMLMSFSRSEARAATVRGGPPRGNE